MRAPPPLPSRPSARPNDVLKRAETLMLMIEERDAEAKRKKKELQKARGVEHYMHAMSNLVGQQLHKAPRGEHRAPLPPVSLIAPAPRPSVLVPRSARTDAERRMRRRASEDQRVGAMRLRMAQLLPELSKAAPMSLKSKRSSATEQRLGDVRPPKRPSATGRSATGRRRLVARKPHPTIRQHPARTRSYKERLARVTASVQLPPSHAAASVGSAAMPTRKTSVGEIVRRASVLSAQRLNLQGMLPPPPSYKDSPPPYDDDDDDDDASSSSGGVLEPLLEEGTSGGDLNPWGGADAAAGSGATPARAEEGGWEEYFDETNQAWYALHAATGRSYWVDEEDDGEEEEEEEDASYSSEEEEEEEEEGGDRLAPLHRQASMSSARRGSTFVSHLLSIDDDLSANSTTRRSVRLSGRFQL